MSQHTAQVTWVRGDHAFIDNKYSRVHAWSFDGGAEVVASSSPSVIPPPMSSNEAVDPEEAFVASLSSCHMLWFLGLAAKRGLVVDQYLDQAEGHLNTSGGKKRFITAVLRPYVTFSGEKRPSTDELHKLHEAAHEQCYLANSVNFEVRIEMAISPVFSRG